MARVRKAKAPKRPALEKKLCRMCFRRHELTEALTCADCLADRIKIEHVYTAARGKYPKLSDVSVGRFVEILWHSHLKLVKGRKKKSG